MHSVNGSTVINASLMKLMIYIWGSFGHRNNDCMKFCSISMFSNYSLMTPSSPFS